MNTGQQVRVISPSGDSFYLIKQYPGQLLRPPPDREPA